MRVKKAIIKYADAMKPVMVAMALLLLTGIDGFAQAPVTLSQTIEQYEGKSYYLHVVESQQTLFGISKAYGITVEALMMANPDARRGIRVNQVLRVPAGGNLNAASMTTAPPPRDKNESDEYEYIYHVAGKNETFAYLADIYLMSERLIRNANPSRGEPFTEGDYILVPIAKKETAPTPSEAQYKRSNFDPFIRTTPPVSQTQQAQPQTSRPAQQSDNASGNAGRQPISSTTPVQTVASFDNPTPVQGNNRPTQQTQSRNAEPVMPNASSKTESNNDRHIVKPQETLFGVARQYNVTPAAILAANPGMSENLKAGQVVKIPTPQHANQQAGAPTGSDSTFYHSVQKGETLFRISRQYAVSIDELKKINPGLTETLKVGQRILISKKKITQPWVVHKVESAKKTKVLARDFGVSMDEIYDLNPTIGKQVFPNQKVKIPLDASAEYIPVKPGQPVEKEALKEVEEEIFSEEIASIETSECIADEKNIDHLYCVALMLPLFLEDVDKMTHGNMNSTMDGNKPRPLTFLPFYNGFLMAADSLANHFGLKLDLMVFDVDQSLEKTAKAMNDPRLKKADLIIGPFFSQPFDKVASFAKENRILIVNPMSQRRQITEDNPYVVKLKPDVSEQFSQVATAIASNYPDAKVFVFHANNFRHADELRMLREELENVIPEQIKISNAEILRSAENYRNSTGFASEYFETEGQRFDLNSLRLQAYDSSLFENIIRTYSYDQDSLRKFRKEISKIRDNVVIVYSEDRVFSMEFINKINQMPDSVSVKVFGLPHWHQFDNLFNEHLLRLNAHFLEPGFIDYVNINTQFFVHQYREKHGAEPDNYAFEGFDIGWYFLSALQRYGNDASDCLPDYRAKLLQTSYAFKRTGENQGFENSFWNIYSYRNFKLMPVRNSYFYKR